MKGTLVMIRADASRRIGAGHVARCLALAQELREEGARVVFACRQPEGHLADVLEQEHGFAVRRLEGAPSDAPPDEEADAGALLRAIEATGRPDWLVVDHYELGAPWEARLRPHVGRILAIDDLPGREHEADLLLDPNAGAAGRRAAASGGPAPWALAGPRFALLRREFRETRARTAGRRPSVGRVLVSFGGSDARDLTSTALRALRAASLTRLEVDVVLGTASPHLERVEALVAERPGTRLHVQTDRMAHLVAHADLAVGAAGTSALERCCLGLPTVAVSVAPNQEPGAEALARHGALLYLGPAPDVDEVRLAGALSLLVANRPLREHLAGRGRELVDGRGAARVVRAMHGLARVEVREATAADCGALHAWRNHPAVRERALDPTPIPLEAHRHWFEGVLRDARRVLLVGACDGAPLGVLRYDLDDAGEAAEVSIYLAPARIGQGLGGALLAAGERWLARERPDVRRIDAVVRGDNGASLALFARNGFGTERVTFRKSMRRGGVA